jgi:serine/threonine protein kinase
MDDEPSDMPPAQTPATVTTRRRGSARAADAEPVARVGDVLLGRFRLQRILGRGGMGVVFAANDLQMQGEPLIAVKLLNEDMRDFPVAAMALERECRKVRMLANDSIVRVFEFYRTGEQTFITMELLEGDSLDVIIKRFPQGVPWGDAWMIIRSAADALAYAHRQKPPFVHSDFKPSNVFCTRGGQIKVLDFGVARAARTSDKAATNLSIFDPAQYGALTPAYASAEMLAGLNADVRDDVYALACVTYEVLCGEHPFARRPADQARAMMLKPKPIPSVGGRVNRALAHGLAVDRMYRTPTVAQFIEELGDAPEPSAARWRRYRKWALTGGAIAAAVILGFGVWRLVPRMHWPIRAAQVATTSTVPLPSPQLPVPPSIHVGTPKAAPETPHVRPAAEEHVPATSSDTIPGERVLALLQLLGVANNFNPRGSYPETNVRKLIETSPRKVTLGSTPEQMKSALALCRRYSTQCQESWYADEKLRTPILEPFELDPTPVSVREFRRFADDTPYRTEAESAGFAYAVLGESLKQVNGGSWRNAITQRAVGDDEAVVGVSFRDAQAFCRARKERLPTEDEWEYAARGPERRIFPWGDSVGPATRNTRSPPGVTEGPAEGIGGRYHGMSGNVWQWVDTSTPEGTKYLKGGSWLVDNPANRRAAVQRMEQPSRADSDSGFRCARSVAVWPDTDLWLARLK